MKYTEDMMKKAKDLFPDNMQLHDMMRMGDTKAVDMVYAKISFYLDEDDIIKAFRNKKENKILEMAKRAKLIRELYQQMFTHMEKMEMKKAEKYGYMDCI